jgi:hypothetical protein
MIVNYPTLAFAFNPIRVDVSENDMDIVYCEAGGIFLERETRDGKTSFDLSAIAQSLFDRKEFRPKTFDNVLMKTLTVEVFNGPDYETFNISVIWGALQIGETYSQKKTLNWFKNLPFTAPLLLAGSIDLKMKYDNTGYSDYMQLHQGKHNIPINAPDANRFVYLGTDNGGQGVFDYTFDYTFRTESGNYETLITLIVNECTDGIYLRWINKYGEYCYYLFNQGVESREISNSNIDIRERLVTEYISGYNSGTNHPLTKEVEKSIRLSAPLVDGDTFKFLYSLIESPVVDLFNGYGDNNTEKWVGVNIAAGTFIQDNTPLQDFECAMVLPEIFNQSL